MREIGQEKGALPYALLTLAVLVLAIAGYAGYTLYPRFQLPAVTGAGLLLLAVGAGIASFFSPCSFPLLATLLAREAGGGERPSRKAVFGHALSLSAGVSLFLLLAGLAISAGGGPLFEGITFTSAAGRAIRGSVGALLVLLGLIQTGVLRTSLFLEVEKAAKPVERIQARMRRLHPGAGFFVFGFGYVLAGFG